MDKDTISLLKDYESSIEKSFKKIDKSILPFIKNDKNKKSLKSSLKQELEKIEKNIDLMKLEIQNLKDQEEKDLWNEKKSTLKSKFQTYSKMDISKISKLNRQKVDHLDPDAKVNHRELTSQQAMDRGDLLVKVDGNIIGRIGRVVNGDIDTIKGTNEELNIQKEKLENVDKDLVEIDYSLNRARNKITSMFKMYSKDKCIICLIVVILIIIVTIIIISACGGDNANNFNVPHDIFSSNNKTTNSARYFSRAFTFMNIISLIFLYLL